MKTRSNDVPLDRQPSAYLPVAISLAALVLVLAHAAVFGIVHETDEGVAADTWQILVPPSVIRM